MQAMLNQPESLENPEKASQLANIARTYGFSEIPSLPDITMLIEHLSWALNTHGLSSLSRQQARLVRSIQKGLVRDA